MCRCVSGGRWAPKGTRARRIASHRCLHALCHAAAPAFREPAQRVAGTPCRCARTASGNGCAPCLQSLPRCRETPYSGIGAAPMVREPGSRHDRPILDFDQAENVMSRATLAATTLCAALLISACERPGTPPAAGSGSAVTATTTAAPAPAAPTPPMPPPAAPGASSDTATARDTAANRPADPMTRQEESTSMPKAGQVNNESSTALDKP